MPLTHLDMFRATMAHRRHEGFLFYAHFTELEEKKVRTDLRIPPAASLEDRFGMRGWVAVDPQPPKDAVKPDYSVYYRDLEVPTNSYIDGNGTLHVPGSVAHFTHYVSALRKAGSFQELEKYPFPSMRGHTDGHMAEAVRAAHAEGRYTVSWGGHMYEDSWQIRGYEEFLVDMIEKPEWCQYILDRIMENNLARVEASARAGVDMIRTGDDVANQVTLMFSREQWRRFMKPRWAKVFAAARRINPDIVIWYHSDGNITDIVPELIEIGVNVLNPLQPECLDLRLTKRRYGDKLVFDGTVGTQTTMPFGTAEEVRRVVRERAADLGGDGALILSPTHVLEPEVPTANVVAFMEEAASIGIA
jgi:uroporphyrinogen decarboxylase